MDNNSGPDIIMKDTLIFSERVAMGMLNNGTINEASGMAMSLENPHGFWTHNDSGDKSRIFLVDTFARYQMTVNFTNATNRDWEDIAVSKDPLNGHHRIFIGDIGDNNAIHKYSTIYIVKEPKITTGIDTTIDIIQKITYKYEDGSRDAESLMVDPITGDIYIVSKREANVNLYQIQYPYATVDTIIAKKVLTLPYSQIVAGDISQDGTEILLKSYKKVWYWSRKKEMSVASALSQSPYETTYISEPQGESVCWAPDAKGFYTISEESPLKITPILYKYIKVK